MLIDVPSDRRKLLRLALAAAGTLWLPRAAWPQPAWSSDPFKLGVASGSPTHEGVVLWTRLVGDVPPEAVAVRWELAHDEAFTRIARRGESMALPQLAHSVHAEVGGLEPDRWYFYRFMCGEALSPVGRTRTFPAPGAAAARLRLAYASCQRWEHGYFSAWRHMQAESLDAVVFLGDYIYEYPASARPVRLPGGGWLITLDDYRQRYALHKAEPELQGMHAACPWLVTWDDHEVQNDYAGLTPGNAGPEVADFRARRAAAYQAFYEHMPVRASVLTRSLQGLAAGAEVRMYSRVSFGALADIVLLDDRQYRDAQVCTPGGRYGSAVVPFGQCPEWNDPARTLLGSAQERWFDQAMAARQGTWNVIGQQTLFGHRLSQQKGEPASWNDGWDGYPAARARLLDSLGRHRVANTVMLGGDMHENWVGHVKADYSRPDSAALGVEFCGTSITSRSGGDARVQADLARNPHFVFADGERKGYGVAEFTPQRLTTTLRAVDDVARRDTGVSTLARFEVAAGTPKVERLA